MKKIGSFISIIIALFIVVLVISDWTQQSEIKRADNPDKKGLASYQKGQVEKEISISQVCTIDKKGRIFVDVDPKDARIRIYEHQAQNFIKGMELPPGRYRVKIDKNGYKTISEWVSLGIGQALTATSHPAKNPIFSSGNQRLTDNTADDTGVHSKIPWQLSVSIQPSEQRIPVWGQKCME